MIGQTMSAARRAMLLCSILLLVPHANAIQIQPEDWEGLVGCIDFPNKVMALQSQGTPDRKQIDEWMKQKQRNLNVILKSYHTPPEEINPDYIATVHKFCEEIVLQKTSYPTFNYNFPRCKKCNLLGKLIDAIVCLIPVN